MVRYNPLSRRTIMKGAAFAGLAGLAGTPADADPPDDAGRPDDAGPPDHAGPDIRALDPRGIRPTIELTPLAPRPDDLSESTVWLVDTGDNSDLLYDDLEAELKTQYEGVTIEVVSGDFSPSDEFLNNLEEEADAFVYGGNPGSTGTGGAASTVIELESRGVPGVLATSKNMTPIAEWEAEVSGTPIRIVSIPTPMDELSDAEVNEAVDGFIEALTKPLTDEEQQTGTVEPEPPGQVAIEGTNAEIQEYFHEQGWTEGQAIVPPTTEAVEEMLEGTSADRDEIIAEDWGPAEWDVTVESVAINAVMVGAKPEYMPVLLAMLEAADEVRSLSPLGSTFGFMARSTNGFGAMQVVNGPIADEIGMNSSTGALGPGYHANATIGRALWVFIRTLGGGQSGVNMMPTMGNNARYGGTAFAENEERSPWKPLHVSEGGYDEDESVLTFMVTWNSMTGNYTYRGLDRARELADTLSQFEYPMGMVPLISPEAAIELADNKGMSKADFADFMYEETTHELADLRENRLFWDLVEIHHDYDDVDPAEEVPVYPREFIRPIVVGGHGQVPHHHGWVHVGDAQVSIDDWR